MQKSSSQEEVEVTIRNLPNEAKTDDILEYLSIAGPVKSHKFIKEEERCNTSSIKTAPSLSTMTHNQQSSAKNISVTGTTKEEC